ncbi:MAG TPA: UDP-glucose/GDP-mannose dehydrogenase family protein [Candidatus Acidoferrales bacterium]|nr:UDP-glucose/GDP-mannose dehydrogenase family protein [Candidatus Acidoferrales bacterium]
MRISIVGCGYVGLVTGGCLAAIGNHVTCVDSDPERIRSLQAGHIPIYEPHLEDLIAGARAAGLIEFSGDLPAAVRGSETIFICVGTPPLENGEADLSSIEAVARVIASESRGDKLVVEKSTVPVRTGEQLRRALEVYGRANGAKFQVVSNPEFLREGSSVFDFLHPDRIVVGVENAEAGEKMREIYRPILERKFACPVHAPAAAGCPTNRPPQFVVTTINSSELIKHASNSFLALKISFANVLADLCERLGANVEEVTNAMGMDPRIGPQFLNAGIGFGGFCFPKDIQAFYRLAERAGVDFTLLKEAERINKDRVSSFLEKARRALWVLKGKQVGLLGLAFKPHTDDIRFAPALEILKQLLAEGASVRAYDPQAMKKTEAQYPAVKYCKEPYEVAVGADAVLLLTEWPEFKEIDWQRVHGQMLRPLVLDGRNLLDPKKMRDLGFEYHSIGRPD